jgi:menaquinone-dependent protoporphyrinogen oxidase
MVGVMAPPPRLLVCYASAAGSTRGIAERLAERLRSDLGVSGPGAPEVACLPAGTGVDPTDYDALVVGSAVHDMAWLPPAAAVLDRATGAGRPVWVFSVGGVQPRGVLTRLLVARERTAIERTFPDGFVPRDHRVFGGVVVTTGLPPWGRLFWWLVGGRPGDHRDWPAVERWAAGIAAEFTARPGAPPRTRAGAPPR